VLQAENKIYTQPSGEKNSNSISTEEQVIEIKALNKQGLGKRRIAKLLGCTESQAQSAITGWKHLD
jgi:hypothetical protein